ncbi:hypothetical protein IPV08_10685 [Methylobacterium sp. SD274]|uniref:hypothetical protein n=1 Tax=Methylobacterium sp. SD274 TaxID=2782009 RepID=UPI001A979487|nr:hypothetical protein [Methylobacterium sp. SD274]MBO1020434.1 hypothetical protein [Methylobacterium sp. SD274]
MNLHEPNLSHDAYRQVDEVFRCLSSFKDLGEVAFKRAVRAVLVTMGRAAHEEGERRARGLAERSAPCSTDVRVTTHAQLRGDPDGFDIAH